MTKTSRVKWIAVAGIPIVIGAWMPFALSYMHKYGSDAYGSQKYEESRYWLLLPGYLGNNHSQALLGAMYAIGQGVSRDGPSAFYWLGRAASAEVTEAQTMLGALYASGAVGSQDHDKAIFWLSRAAQRGDRQATEMLRAYRLRSGMI